MDTSPAGPAAAAIPGSGGADVLLADGRIARIRPVSPDDRDALERLHEEASDESVRFRFFNLNRAMGLQYADHLTTPGSPATGVIALVVEYDGRIVAVASAEPSRTTESEISFLVSDDAHGVGLGTLLLEHLAAAARDRGIRRFTAEVLSDNTPMNRVFRDAGFDVRSTTADGVTTLELDTAATDRAVAAADRREFAAEARSLSPLLAPRSVAVVGARRNGTGIGHAVLEGVRRNGFTGELVLVHPRADQLADLGCRVVPDFAAIGHPVDLAIVAVPAAEVVDVARQAAEAGVRALVVVSSGLGEIDEAGRRQQHELVALARRHSMRVVGPNCLGLIANVPGVTLNATFSRGLPAMGGLAMASQSGGVGIALLDAARESGLGLSYFVSLGNKADVSGNDLLAAWYDDDRVSAAALYLESFGNPRKFARIARRFSERKPVLAVVGGRSEGGRRAGLSHTAAAAAPAVGVEALFRHAGVIACRSMRELADTAHLLARQPLPGGPRVAIIGNAGGLGVLAADRAGEVGLVVPELSTGLQATLGGRVSATTAVSNPVDLGAGVSADQFGGAVSDVLTSTEVDALLVVIAGTGVSDTTSISQAITEARRGTPDLPVLLVAVGEVDVPAGTEAALARFRSVEDAIEALGNTTAYAVWRAAPAGSRRSPAPDACARARAIATELSAHEDSPVHGWLPVDGVRDLLACYDVDGPVGALVADPADATGAASRIGFPVVVKVADPDVIHKSDRGLVRVGLTSPDAVGQAVESFAAELGREHFPVLVQPEVGAGVEVAVGVVSDPGFGPLVMVAAGGVATEVWQDRVFLVPPITDVDAARAVRSLRIWPLLAGYRGAPRVDVEALEQLILRVGQLADEVPELAEADLNPVIMTPRGAAVVDVRMRVRPADRVPDAGIPRQLRAPR